MNLLPPSNTSCLEEPLSSSDITTMGDAGATTTLIRLPQELFDQIGPRLTTKEVANVRNTCSLLGEAFMPHLANTLVLRLSHQLGKATSTKRVFTPFIATPHALVKFIKELHVELDYPVIGWRLKKELSQEMIDSVLEEITRFDSLSSLRIQWASKCPMAKPPLLDLTRVEEDLLSSIQATPHLQHLTIGSSFLLPRSPGLPPPLGRFVHLRSLSVCDISPSGQDGPTIISLIQNVLATNPRLESLNIAAVSHEQHISLDALFPPRSSLPQLPLRELTFSGNFTWPPAPTGPANPHSASASDPAFDFDQIPDLPDLRLLSLKYARATFSPDWNRFWDLLRRRRVRLESLRLLQGATRPVLDYLTSYRGLVRLELPWNAGIVSADEPVVADVLPRHARTLQKLVVQSSCVVHDRVLDLESGLGSGSDATAEWPHPSSFPALKYLYARAPATWALDAPQARRMLAWAEQFPSLEGFTTYWPCDTPAPAPAPLPTGTPAPTPTPAQTPRETLASIRQELVGQTGRPREWLIVYGDRCLCRGEFVLWLNRPRTRSRPEDDSGGGGGEGGGWAFSLMGVPDSRHIWWQ